MKIWLEHKREKQYFKTTQRLAVYAFLRASQTSKEILPSTRYKDLFGGNCENGKNIIILASEWNQDYSTVYSRQFIVNLPSQMLPNFVLLSLYTWN